MRSRGRRPGGRRRSFARRGRGRRPGGRRRTFARRRTSGIRIGHRM